jgi:hypothetical protein
LRIEHVFDMVVFMASSPDPHLDLEALLACDASVLGTPEAIEMLRRVRRLRGLLDRSEASLSNRLDTLYNEGKSAPVVDVLARQQNVSAAEARRRERRARALAKAKAFGEALAKGAVAAEHADVLATATAKLDEAVASEFFGHEASLLERASTSSPEHFARHCNELIGRLERQHGIERNERQRRETRLSRRISPDGMHHMSGVFHPELGARISTAIDAEVAKLVALAADRSADREQLAAEALGNLVAGGHQAQRPGEAEIVVLIDHETLHDGVHNHSVCETDGGAPLPVESVRRLCCNGRICPIILVDGVPINVGRDQRLANRAQRRALRAMYRTCAFTGCDVAFNRCEIHHVVPWEIGGLTDLVNLLPLCSRHHHVIHELSWKLELAEDRTLTITQPDGTVFARTPVSMGAERSARSEPATVVTASERDGPPGRRRRGRGRPRTVDENALPLTA